MPTLHQARRTFPAAGGLCYLVLAAGLLGGACRKKEPPVPVPSVTPPAPPAQPVTVQQISQALQTYMQVSSDFPKDLKVLVDMKLLPNLPPPPPGKHYVIDRQAVRVSVADK
ncbi:MAG: hypothetical protein ABMA26_17690 [Limisphaerales bacterium]